ncbi:MAG: helix-turn-helix domain-containing protein [Microgenomates group bacterium]
MNTLLETVGLTQNESAIYLSLLKHKEKTAAEIARTLHMDKSSCYRAVDSLIEKGLLIANPRKRGTTHSAVSPDVLKELHEQKIRELENKRSELDTFIVHLLKQEESKRSTFIKVETGIEAIRNGMEQNLDAAVHAPNKMIKEFYRLSFPYFKDREHAKWVNEFAKRRIAAGVAIRQIVDFADLDVFAPIMKTDKKLLKEIHLMPKEMKGLYGVRISGDITHIISFDTDQNYIDITIKDTYVTLLMNSLFDFMWEHSKKYI